MTTIIYLPDSIEVLPSHERPNRGMLETISFIESQHDNPGISNKNARRLSGLAADLILKDYDDQINRKIGE